MVISAINTQSCCSSDSVGGASVSGECDKKCVHNFYGKTSRI
jgi:hypothetical protein